MAELMPQERLQPSLLDRLRDDEPMEKQESRQRRVLSLQRLRESVLRDLASLLNSGNLGVPQLSEEHPEVARSVVNYGLPDLAGLTASGVDSAEVEAVVQQAILDFEPRILPHTLRVTVSTREETMSPNALSFQIEGELWAQPVPLELFLKTNLDLETGSVTVVDFIA